MERTVTAVDLIGRFYLATNENDVLNAACLLRNESEANLVPTLIAALQDHWEPRRFGAALALCFKTDRRILRPLIDVVGDARHSSRTRCMAAESLGYLGRRKAIPCLLDGSRDTSSDLRFWSVFALGKFLDRRRCGRTVEQALEAPRRSRGVGGVSARLLVSESGGARHARQSRKLLPPLSFA